MIFVCPKCMMPFDLESGVVRCSSGHCFDRAGAGYYNLLMSHGGNHGDNREMVEARRAFLSAGYYEPLARRIAELAAESTSPCGILLDTGCGEGYYTERVERTLYERDGESRVAAFDISKDAVRRTAKRQSRIETAVASSYRIPVSCESVDTVINVFSPLAKDEVRRVLKMGGRFIVAFPGEEHLWGLKRAVYKTPYKNKPEGTDIEGMELLSDETLRYEISLRKKEDIRSLFMMTPYAYRTGEEERARVLSLEKLDTDVHFRILVYKKTD